MPLTPPSDPAAADRKTLALLTVLRGIGLESPSRTLVVGCGTGAEAGIIARELDSETVGIDIDDSHFNQDLAGTATLQVMDAERLEFPDGTFDFIYSFHAIEHIPNPQRALAEMRRVSKPGAIFVLGTPNKSRLIGYIGSAATFGSKVRWNLQDAAMRLRGKWSNEAGAHAGFSRRDLVELADNAFGDAREVSVLYYRELYKSRTGAVDMLERAHVGALVFPCVYVAGRSE